MTSFIDKATNQTSNKKDNAKLLCDGTILCKGYEDAKKQLNKDVKIYLYAVEDKKENMYRRCSKKKVEDNEYCKSHSKKDNVVNIKNILEGKFIMITIDNIENKLNKRKTKKEIKAEQKEKIEKTLNENGIRKIENNIKLHIQVNDALKNKLSDILHDLDRKSVV